MSIPGPLCVLSGVPRSTPIPNLFEHFKPSQLIVKLVQVHLTAIALETFTFGVSERGTWGVPKMASLVRYLGLKHVSRNAWVGCGWDHP